MIIYEDLNIFYKIVEDITDSNDKENAYLLKGTFNSYDNSIDIVEYMNLDDYIEENTEDRVSIDKKFLYASVKEFKKNNWVYILVHTHPFQTKETLTFSCIDNDFYESLNKVANEIGYNLPLVFGVACKETIDFKIYYNNKILLDNNLDIKFDKCNPEMWNIEILSNNSYKQAILYHKNTNSIRIVSFEDAKKIKEWKKKFEENELSKLNEIEFKRFIHSTFNLNDKMELLSSKNFVETGIISDLRFMIQLGCNLKCKYCYADAGTYGFNKNIVLTETNAVSILNNLINKGVKKIEHISFFGGEPNMFPKTIQAICERCNTLYNESKLISLPKFFLVTNGTIISEALIQTIKKYDVQITISLDGPSYINDELRIDKNGNGTYKTICDNISELRKNSIEPKMIEATYTTIHEINNISRSDLSTFIKNEVKVPIVFIADCSGNEYSPKTIEISSESDLIESINESMFNTDSDNFNNVVLSLISSVIKQMYNKKIKNNLHCSAGYNMISVLGNGDYYPCHRFVEDEIYKIGNLLDSGHELKFKDILSKENIKECSMCWASQFCTGCTWEMITNKEKELLHCNEKRNIIKHILLTFINLDEDGKARLSDNINGAIILKRSEL